MAPLHLEFLLASAMQWVLTPRSTPAGGGAGHYLLAGDSLFQGVPAGTARGAVASGAWGSPDTLGTLVRAHAALPESVRGTVTLCGGSPPAPSGPQASATASHTGGARCVVVQRVGSQGE